MRRDDLAAHAHRLIRREGDRRERDEARRDQLHRGHVVGVGHGVRRAAARRRWPDAGERLSVRIAEHDLYEISCSWRVRLPVRRPGEGLEGDGGHPVRARPVREAPAAVEGPPATAPRPQRPRLPRSPGAVPPCRPTPGDAPPPRLPSPGTCLRADPETRHRTARDGAAGENRTAPARASAASSTSSLAARDPPGASTVACSYLRAAPDHAPRGLSIPPAQAIDIMTNSS